MGFHVKVETKIDIPKHMKQIRSNALWLPATNEYWKLLDPYVSMETGVLSKTVTIVPKEIIYKAPHAHYIYKGKAMGPSYPITKNGQLVGFFSPKGVRKHYTGKSLLIKKDKHPKACANWDKVAKPTQLPKLIRFMQNLIDSGGVL